MEAIYKGQTCKVWAKRVTLANPSNGSALEILGNFYLHWEGELSHSNSLVQHVVLKLLELYLWTWLHYFHRRLLNFCTTT